MFVCNLVSWCYTSSPVDLAEKKSEPGKNSKKADFDIIIKQIFRRLTYPKSSEILLGEKFAHFNIGTYTCSSLCCMTFLTNTWGLLNTSTLSFRSFSFHLYDIVKILKSVGRILCKWNHSVFHTSSFMTLKVMTLCRNMQSSSKFYQLFYEGMK